MMDATDKLQVRTQTKLKIVMLLFYQKLALILKLYHISLTWINQQLDAIFVRHVRNWLQLPISLWVAWADDSAKETGKLWYSVPQRHAERLRLGQRFRLKHSRKIDIRHFWTETSSSINPFIFLFCEILGKQKIPKNSKKNQKNPRKAKKNAPLRKQKITNKVRDLITSRSKRSSAMLKLQRQQHYCYKER